MAARCWDIGKAGVRVSLITSIFVLSGCVAYRFSSDYLPLQESEKSKAMFQELVLGVELTDRAQSYELERFMAALQKTGLFKEVQYLDRLSRADLILTSFFQTDTDPYQACPLGLAGQVLTMGSVGLIPQVCKSEHRVTFVLYSPGTKEHQEKKTLLVNYQTHSIVGWAALFFMPSADWSTQPSEERYPNLVKAVFHREADNLRRLLR